MGKRKQIKRQESIIKDVIYFEDCMQGMKRIPSGSVDIILCDPPYGVTDCAWDKVLPLHEMWAEFNRVLKANGTVVLFSQEPFTTDVISSNRRRFRYKWYWLKDNRTGGLFSKHQPMRAVEEILVFYKKHGTYNPQGLKPFYRINSAKRYRSEVYRQKKSDSIQTATGYPSNVLHFAKDPHNMHPTQKPLALIEYLIKTYTNEGELVLDPCIGSGTTAVAAVNTGRHYIGFEADERYYKIATERLTKTNE